MDCLHRGSLGMCQAHMHLGRMSGRRTQAGFSREARYAAAGGKFTGAALRPRAGRGKRTEPRIAMDERC